MDVVHYNVRQDNAVIKKAVYVDIGIKLDGKEVWGSGLAATKVPNTGWGF